MSQENVEVVRAGFEAWNAGDMDAFGELLAPEIIMWNPEGWPEPGPFVGRGRRLGVSGSSSATSGTPTPWNRLATSSTPPTELWCGSSGVASLGLSE
jgi:ketosteroid isomerase-like protein